MDEQKIKCPKCKATITLTEAIAGPALAEMRATLQKEADDRAQSLDQRDRDFEHRKQDFESLVNNRVSQDVQKAHKEIDAEAQKQINGMRLELQANNSKLAEAQAAQADYIKKSRELADQKRELDLEVERRVTTLSDRIRGEANHEAEERSRLTIAERNRTIEKMREDLAAAQARADQRDQKAQGEVLELNFEQNLKMNFPEDVMVAQSDRGGTGDIHQHVHHNGTSRGTILWELKRTKLWSADWLPKLRGIQRSTQCAAAIVCSQTLPEDVETFGLIDGVWVTSPRFAVALTVVLRRWIIEVDQARKSGEGQATKAELLYQYLTGPQFKHRVSAVAEKLSELRADLNKERTGMTRYWAKREAALGTMADSIAGMFGDVQGLAGKAVGELPSMSLPTETV